MAGTGMPGLGTPPPPAQPSPGHTPRPPPRRVHWGSDPTQGLAADCAGRRRRAAMSGTERCRHLKAPPEGLGRLRQAQPVADVHSDGPAVKQPRHLVQGLPAFFGGWGWGWGGARGGGGIADRSTRGPTAGLAASRGRLRGLQPTARHAGTRRQRRMSRRRSICPRCMHQPAPGAAQQAQHSPEHPRVLQLVGTPAKTGRQAKR